MTGAFLALKNDEEILRIKHFSIQENDGRHLSDYGFKGTVVNSALTFLN